MTTRDILAKNVKTLKVMSGLSNINLAKKCGVGQGTITRALSQESALDIDSITLIAKAFDLEPWQLLVPNLDPANPHHVCHITPEEEALYLRMKAALKTVA